MKKYLLAFLLFFGIVITSNIACSQDANYYYFKANSNLNAGKTTEAINYYNQAINYDKNLFEAYLGLSIAYKELGDYENALKSVEHAIILKPDYYQAYYNLGLILERLNRYDDAIKAYERFLKGVPAATKFSDAKQRISKLKQSN